MPISKVCKKLAAGKHLSSCSLLEAPTDRAQQHWLGFEWECSTLQSFFQPRAVAAAVS